MKKFFKKIVKQIFETEQERQERKDGKERREQEKEEKIIQTFLKQGKMLIGKRLLAEETNVFYHGVEVLWTSESKSTHEIKILEILNLSKKIKFSKDGTESHWYDLANFLKSWEILEVLKN
jgi:hypothetical protein